MIGFVGFYIRHHCSESPAYTQACADNAICKTPVREVFASHRWQMLQGFAIYTTVTMPFYITTAYFLNFSKTYLGLSAADALQFSVYNMLILLVAMPLSAWLSDRIGRKKIMMAAAGTMLLMVYPLFGVFVPGAEAVHVALAQAAFALVLGIYVGPIAAFLVELFPTRVRFTGMAITYNMSAALFGGTALLVCEWLLKNFGTAQAIACYVMLSCTASLVALAFYRDRYREPL